MVIDMEMDKYHDEFVEWMKNGPPEEKLLYDKVYDFGEFFQDMLFEKGTAPYDLIKCQVRVSDADTEQEEWVEDDLL